MKQKVILAVSIIFGLIFINAGLNKFFNYLPVPDDVPQVLMDLMGAIMSFGWLLPLIAIVEIVGGVLFMTNRYRALGAIIILPVMVGIVLTHIVNSPSGLPLALVLFTINLWVILENRTKYAPLFN